MSDAAPARAFRALRRDLPSWAGTLAIGAAGGAAFDSLDLPLAWMLGAIAATTAAALIRLPVRIPKRVAPVMFSVVGVLLGSTFPPDFLDRAHRWSISLAAMLPYVVLITLSVAAYFHRVTAFSHPTRFFSACPGGLNEMMIMGGAKGGDEAAIALVHGMRILTVVYVLPFSFRFLGGVDATAARAAARAAAMPDAAGWAIMAVCAVAGVWGGRKLRIPAAVLVGPLLLSTAAHLSGLTDARPPASLINAAQVVIGCGVGCRFLGVTPGVFGRAIVVSLGSTALMLAIGAAFAAALAPLTGESFAALVLAYSPGGITEMSLIALAMGTDPMFVSTHHLGRIVIVLLTTPLLFRWLPHARKEAAAE